jgi:DNA-binding transcriptional ArsR family regulator
MTLHADALRLRLAAGPKSGSQIATEIGLSQPTVTRALAAMGEDVIKTGQRKSTRYLLRDKSRGFGDVPVYRVDAQGKVRELGTLAPVRPDGFVFTQADGVQIHSEGLPWWLLDMRPQGFLGRAYAARFGAELGLPSNVKEWTDSHAIRALLVHGHDLVGNLLIGTISRDKFINMPEPQPISSADKSTAYASLAIGAAEGDSPGSSAGGEQPKFTAYAESAGVAKHVIVKFSEQQISPNSSRWRDLLLAEHMALKTLRQANLTAAESFIYDHQGQRFLEVERFDRVGTLGRKAVISLAAFDAEFAGLATQPWPVITKALAKQGVITPDAAEVAEILWAFGALIGNSDMHNGNLSFVSEHGRPYALAPAYDMTPMSFAPTSSGRLPDAIHPVTLHASVRNDSWRRAQKLATNYLSSLRASDQFNLEFQVCIDALATHLESASTQINRLA